MALNIFYQIKLGFYHPNTYIHSIKAYRNSDEKECKILGWVDFDTQQVVWDHETTEAEKNCPLTKAVVGLLNFVKN